MFKSITSLSPKIILILILIAFDQWSKHFVLNNLAGERINFLFDLFEINLQHNTGIAFSLFDDSGNYLKSLNTVILALIIYWLYRQGKLPWAFTLIIAGGLGNLIDRYTLGFVVDFINPLFFNFAVFNFADIYLNLGVAWIIIRMLLTNEKTLV